MPQDKEKRDGRALPATWEELDAYVAETTKDLQATNKQNHDWVQIMQALDYPVIRIDADNTMLFFSNAFFIWGEFDGVKTFTTEWEIEDERDRYWGKRSILDLLPPEEHERFEDLKQRAHRQYFDSTGRFKTGVADELTFVSYKGTRTPCRASVTYSNVYKAYQVSFLDITAQKEAENGLREARDEMEARVVEATRDLEEKSRLVMEMSTPVVKLWNGVTMLPLIGTIDGDRATQMTESLLNAIANDDARVAVLDVTGIAELDTSVARHILSAVGAARILGAEVIVTGFSPEAAQTLAQLGVDFTSLRTRGSLQMGVREALNLIGVRIEQGR